MDVNRMARAAVTTASIGISGLLLGIGPVSAVPLDPPTPPSPVGPAPDEPPAPGPGPGPKIALPQSGGSQHGGHALPVQPSPGSP
jgi:hypothetical protein